jgi:hypothetical protein
MPDSVDPDRPTRSSRACLLTVAALLSAVLVAGCGGSSPNPTTTVGGATTSTVAAGDGAASSGSNAQATGASPVAFASCMRANGVPNFPDPKAGGGFVIPAGANPAAPAFMAAQVKCKKFLPGGGPPGPGAKTHPSAQTLEKLVRIAQCMRQHGVPQFPDPETSVPLNLAGYGEITDLDGVILVFPGTLDMQAPAYRHALVACGAPPLGLRH